jgi:hypothetical protein
MNESPIFTRTYDFLLWLLPQTARFPRQYRFSLGERLARQALDFHELLITAGISHGVEQQAALKQADGQLVQLHQMMRLCKDLEIISLSQYEHVSRLLNELGRLLGGWLKKFL